VQQEPEPVVREVAEAEAHSLDLLDEEVHGSVGPLEVPAVVKVGQQLGFPGGDGAAEPLQLGDAGKAQ
jgi:hypothetical protein